MQILTALRAPYSVWHALQGMPIVTGVLNGAGADAGPGAGEPAEPGVADAAFCPLPPVRIGLLLKELLFGWPREAWGCSLSW